MVNDLTDNKIAELADMVRKKYGLDFSQDRWRDLRKAVCNFHEDQDRFCSSDECLNYILSAQASRCDLEQFINRLTIGETYFFRDPHALSVLEMDFLRKRNGRGSGDGGAIRIWSMACATGEEPYTMAMICRRSNVRSEIFGTDIDSRALARAGAGHYRKWSFRSDSTAYRDMYFKQNGPNDYVIDKSIRDMVSLSRFNLIGDDIPSSFKRMDLILCRNVLMYFSNDGVKLVLEKIWESLSPGGFLLVTPSESSLVTVHGRFEPVSFGSVMLFCKNEDYSPPEFGTGNFENISSDQSFSVPEFLQDQSGQHSSEDSVYELPGQEAGPDLYVREDIKEYAAPEPENAFSAGDLEESEFLLRAEEMRGAGDTAGAVGLLRKVLDNDSGLSRELKSEALLALAFIKADCGMLEEASQCCRRSIELDRIAPQAHFLQGQIMMQQGLAEEAVSEFRNTLFLAPSFIMAHVMLGNIYMERRDCPAAARHFRAAIHELQALDSSETVPYSDGMTAAVLIEMVKVVQQNLF